MFCWTLCTGTQGLITQRFSRCANLLRCMQECWLDKIDSVEDFLSFCQESSLTSDDFDRPSDGDTPSLSLFGQALVSKRVSLVQYMVQARLKRRPPPWHGPNELYPTNLPSPDLLYVEMEFGEWCHMNYVKWNNGHTYVSLAGNMAFSVLSLVLLTRGPEPLKMVDFITRQSSDLLNLAVSRGPLERDTTPPSSPLDILLSVAETMFYKRRAVQASDPLVLQELRQLLLFLLDHGAHESDQDLVRYWRKSPFIKSFGDEAESVISRIFPPLSCRCVHVYKWENDRYARSCAHD